MCLHMCGWGGVSLCAVGSGTIHEIFTAISLVLLRDGLCICPVLLLCVLCCSGVLHPSLSVLLRPPSPSSPIEWAVVGARLLTGLSLLVLTKTLAKPIAQVIQHIACLLGVGEAAVASLKKAKEGSWEHIDL